MAKKDDDHVKDVDIDLDFGDLDDDPFNEIHSEASVKQKKRTPIEDVKAGALDGLKLKSEDIGKISKSINDNFQHFGSVVEGTLDTAGEISSQIRDLKESVAPSVRKLKVASRKALPFAKKLIPSKIYDKIKDKLETESRITRQSIEAERTGYIKEQLANIFTAQVEMQQEQQIEATKNKLIDQHVSDKQFTSNITVLSKIKNLLKQQTSIFQTGIKTYIVKSLELKYKSLFVIQDTLDVQRKLLDVTDNKLKAIAINTSLPDIQKQRKSESFKMAMRELTSGKLAQTAGGYASTFFSKISENIKKNIFDKLKSAIKDSADMGTDLLEGITEMEEMKAEEGIKTSGFETGAKIGTGFTKALGIKFAGKLAKELGGQQAKDFDDVFRVMRENAPFVIDQKLSKMAKKEGLGGKLASFMRENIVPKLTEERGIVSNVEMENPTETVPWDVISRKTLIEIIPGYLSKISMNTESIATGKPAEEMVYDFGVGDFVSVKSLRESTFKKFFGTKESRAKDIQKMIATIFAGYKKNGGDINDLNINMPDLIKFVNNITKHAQPFLPKEILKFHKDESFDKDYIGWVFKGISDPKPIAKIISTAFFKGDKVIGQLEREFSSSAIEVTKSRDEYLNELGKLNIYGQKRYFTDLIKQEKSVEELQEYKDKLTKKALKKSKSEILSYEEKEKIRLKVQEFANKKGLNHKLIRNILSDIDYETLYETMSETQETVTKKLEEADKKREKNPTKEIIDKIKISSRKKDKQDKFPLRDDPHISGPGIYAQGSKFEAHIPLDSPSGFFSGFKQILDEVDYKTTLIEIRNILEQTKSINLSNLSGVISSLALNMKDAKSSKIKNLFKIIKAPISFSKETIKKTSKLGLKNLSKVTDLGIAGSTSIMKMMNKIPFVNIAKKLLPIPFEITEMAVKGAKSGYEKIKSFMKEKYIKAKDIYLKGDVRPGFPLITKAQILNGELIRSDGKIVRSLKDITMPIMLKSTGETLITKEDLEKGLVDIKGKAIKIGKKALNLTKRLFKGLVGIPAGLFNVGAKGVSLGIKGFTSIINMLFGKKDKKGGFFSKIKDSFSIAFRSRTSEVIERLDKIISLLQESQPEEMREGSYEEQMLEKEKDKEYNESRSKKKKKKRVKKKKKFKLPSGIIKKASSIIKSASPILTGAIGAAITTTATTAASAAAGIGSMGIAAGSFLLTNPIGWTIMGAAAVGAGSYFLYKFFSESDQEELALKVRMEIYGTPKKLKKKIKKLEKETIDNLENKKKMSDGDLEDWTDEFGLDENKKDQVSFWLTWYKKRFVPSLILYDELLQLSTGKKINEIDEIPIEKIEEVNRLFKTSAKSKIAAFVEYSPTKESFAKINKSKEERKKEKEANKKAAVKTAIEKAKVNKTETKKFKITEKKSDAYKYLKEKSPVKNKKIFGGGISEGGGAGGAFEEELSSELGSLSAKEESGRYGSYAVGFDSVGGTSYGKYQIATRTGTFDRFLAWCDANGGKDVANRLRSMGDPDQGPNGPVSLEWKRLVKEGKIGSLEKGFIKATHYQAALDKMPVEIQQIIKKSSALQQVLWSTSVQHGPNEAVRIFTKAYTPNISNNEFISNIYSIRGTKFKSSTLRVRASVKRRFNREKTLALAMLKDTSQKVNEKDEVLEIPKPQIIQKEDMETFKHISKKLPVKAPVKIEEKVQTIKNIGKKDTKTKNPLKDLNVNTKSKFPLRDDPHISGPGIYAQGSKFEAHIPLDSPSGFFSGFKQILDEVDYKTTLLEIKSLLEYMIGGTITKGADIGSGKIKSFGFKNIGNLKNRFLSLTKTVPNWIKSLGFKDTKEINKNVSNRLKDDMRYFASNGVNSWEDTLWADDEDIEKSLIPSPLSHNIKTRQTPAMQNAANVIPEFMSNDVISRSTSPKIQFSDLVNINKEQLLTLKDIRSGIMLLSKLANNKGDITSNRLFTTIDNMNQKLETLIPNKEESPTNINIDMTNLLDITKKEIRI